MPRFHLHLWTGTEHVTDQEGDELESVEAAYLEAFEAAKEMAADLIRSHSDVARYRFDVVDGAGRSVFELPFTEVLGKSSKPRRAPIAGMDKRKELIEAVAHEITIARATIAAAQETLDRSARSAARRAAAARAAASAKPA
jgi:hypothetical protein